ncbi:MAG: prepilin-type N-terminal cleavage/methylation domain-containing protein [bacterium]
MWVTRKDLCEMRRHHAFTLIELLIVVAIIGILAAIAVPNFMNARIRAKIARVRADFSAAALAAESYHIDRGTYPYTADLPAHGATVCGRYRPFTTPISYITSALYDPFGDEGRDAPLGGTAEYPCYDFFFGKPGDVFWPWLVNAHYLVHDGMEVRWQITSQGPDRRAHTGIPYDSSNGLDSPGDIKRYGPGDVHVGY